MEITHTQFKHCDVVKVSGRVDSSTAPLLSEALTKITESGRYRIVVDMGGLDFISSAGLRALISTQKSCRRYNRGEIALASVPSNVAATLDLAGFTPLFKIFADATAAVGNF
ncbi:MAG TPA: STAS domain-containing protein [Longilinea sp.]|nr:STAS domain-containing protein [Longilinea sp.]